MLLSCKITTSFFIPDKVKKNGAGITITEPKMDANLLNHQFVKHSLESLNLVESGLDSMRD